MLGRPHLHRVAYDDMLEAVLEVPCLVERWLGLEVLWLWVMSAVESANDPCEVGSEAWLPRSSWPPLIVERLVGGDPHVEANVL